GSQTTRSTAPQTQAATPTFGQDKFTLHSAGDRQFPPGFLWGSSTAGHQVDGDSVDDWTRFEGVPGKIAGGDRPGQADRHWDLFEQDLRAARAMNQNAYRFSIEWSRVEPRPGVFDQEALEHYRRMLAACKANGLK